MALIKSLQRISIFCFLFLFIIEYFSQNQIIQTLNSILLLIIVIPALPSMPLTNKRISLGLILVGALFLISNQATLQMWLIAIAKNAGLVALLLTVPLIRLPFFYDNYIDELKHFSQKYMKNVWTFCLLIFIISHILGVTIMIGAIPLVYTIFIDNARMYNAEKLFLAAMLQGYMTAGFWSPSWSSVPIISSNLPVTWLNIIPYSIFFALISMSLSLFLIFIKIRKNPSHYKILLTDEIIKINWHHILTMLFLSISLITAIIVISYITSWNVLIIIPIIAFAFPIITAFIQNKKEKCIEGLKNYYHTSLFRSKNEIVLFASAGFLGKSLELAGIDRYITKFLPSQLSQYPFIIIAFLLLVMVIIALGGIHPVVTGSALISAISPATIGLSPMVFSLTMLFGWALSIMISPFSAVSLMVSGFTGKPSWDISLKINGPYGFILLFLLSALLAVLTNLI